MTTSKNATPAKFKWNEENTTEAVALYAELLGATVVKGNLKFENDKQPDHETQAAANSEKSLNAIAEKVGAKSGRAVRGKLSKEGVYIALEPQAAPSTSSRISKGQYVRSIAKGLGLDLEAVQTLDKANLDALEALTGKVSALLVASGGEAIKVA